MKREGKKKKYNKPAIKQVSLVPEEAVLAACKTVTGPIQRTGRAGICSYAEHGAACSGDGTS